MKLLFWRSAYHDLGFNDIFALTFEKIGDYHDFILSCKEWSERFYQVDLEPIYLLKIGNNFYYELG